MSNKKEEMISPPKTEPIEETIRKPTTTVTNKSKIFVNRTNVLSYFIAPHATHQQHIEDTFQEDQATSSWEGKIVYFIHSHTVQLVLILLLLLDVAVVVTELIIGGHTECTLFVNRDKCLGNRSLLPDFHSGTAYSNTSGFFSPSGSCGVFGVPQLPHTLHKAEWVLGWVSRVILMIFIVELVALLAALRHRFFTVLYTIDAVIVITSFVLSLTIDYEAPSSILSHGIPHMQSNSETSVIIFLRLWRFARVLHGFGITVHDMDEDKSKQVTEMLQKQVESLSAENLQLRQLINVGAT